MSDGRAHDLPLALVNHLVMAITEKDEVWKVSRPIANPVHQVVARGPGRRPVAARPHHP